MPPSRRARYVRKPTEIEAVEWDGSDEALEDIRDLGATVEFNIDGLKLLAGVDGVQGMVPVPVGHHVVKAAANDFYPVEGVYMRQNYSQVDPVPSRPNPPADRPSGIDGPLEKP